MSALVRYFLSQGYNVGGYDRVETPLTKKLCEEGATIHYEDGEQHIPTCFKDKAETLVVYTPAIPATHEEFNYFRREGFEMKKRAEVLGIITRQMKGLCCAGTHGKTTTSAMTAHLLNSSSLIVGSSCNSLNNSSTFQYHIRNQLNCLCSLIRNLGTSLYLCNGIFNQFCSF